MKQVTQTLRTGVINVNDVPIPTLSDKFILVRNTASVISAGTEKNKIDMGKKSLLQKAKARPDLVKQVIKKIQTEGIKKTIQTVNSRLDSPSPLGYSCTGSVIAAGGLVKGIQPGDRVACGGANYANHAEYVAIPENLVVKVPENVSDEEAAFTTVGSIALQGIRLAEPKLGETFLVLGLGLLGQIAVQLLKANGCKVIGTDLNASLVSQAEKFGAIGIGSGSDIETICKTLTGGHGVDGVLVCAASSSNQPIELSGAVTREKGRVVVVGAVRMDIPREDFFKKEINVVISRSYGPGRYDPQYEESGNDYPLGYVRFTEQRNMQTVLELISQSKLDVKSLITHRFFINEAAAAYQLIEGKKTEPYLGILMQYDTTSRDSVKQTRIEVTSKELDKDKLGISFFGAGNYATASLLPPLRDKSDIEFRGIATASGRTAQGAANQFGFSFCAGDYQDLINSDTDVIMVATRHDTHASSVISALNAKKHVYVEKPLGLTVEELAKIYKAQRSNSDTQIMVGFNRRFAPSTTAVQEFFQSVKSPLVVNIRINAGSMSADQWIQDPQIGGGRMIGEGCHFVDLASALTGSSPKRITCIGTEKSDKSALLNDNVSMLLKFENGSIANITYCADGSSTMTKEYIEVFGGGQCAVINDFKETFFYNGDSKIKTKKLTAQDKGQRAMLDCWLVGLKQGVPCVSFECLMSNSLATILAVESLATGTTLDVDFSIFNLD